MQSSAANFDPQSMDCGRKKFLDALVSIGPGNGLFPDGTKPLPEPKLTYHPWYPMRIMIWRQYHNKYLNHQLLNLAWKLLVYNLIQITKGPIS